MKSPYSTQARTLRLLAIAILLISACHSKSKNPKTSLVRSSVGVQKLPSEAHRIRADQNLGDRVEFKLAAPRAARRKGAVDVVLVTLDTTRADYLQPYGAQRATSPFLAALAKQGVTFAHAFSTASWTSPSMASVMTGLYPSEHGVHDTTLEHPADVQVGIPVLSDEALTLAEMLHGVGFKTFGVCTNLLINTKAGFAQGYDEFVGEDTYDKPFPRIAVESLHEQIRGSEKYFLWLHYFDAHWAYVEQAPWFGQWNDSPFRTGGDFIGEGAKWIYRHKHGLTAQAPIEPTNIPRLIEQVRAINFEPNSLVESIRALTDGPEEMRVLDDYLDFVRAAYQSELRANDYDVQRLLEALGVDDDTLLVITADHGDEFLDHGRLGHNTASLYNELIQVPLIIRLPGGKHAGKIVQDAVSLVDLVPSLLQWLKLPTPQGLSGHSFVDDVEGTKPAPARELIAELDRVAEGNYRAAIGYPWKYIHHQKDGSDELYNLEADPHEQHNLVSEDKVRAEQLRQRLVDWERDAKPRWPVPHTLTLDNDQTKILQALGYAREE